ncbi:uncharacterized protein LOC136066889 [Quercus suber]|uniref:uncharacterized protein LOC136066889 n=1 Tax=Quercus suber TaxID=58331 RepID=UPI0032DE9538
MEGDFDEVALNTFKLGLPAEHGLRKSLTRKPVTSVLNLMDRIDKYKRVEEDQQQGKCYPSGKEEFQYHQDHGHIIEDCRSIWDHLEQLVYEGKLKQLLHHSSGQGSQASSESRRDVSSRPPLGTINVIFVALGRTGFYPSRVMSIALLPTEDVNQDLKRAKTSIPPVLEFLDKDKIETIQPHDETLVITLRIGGIM